MDDETPGGTVRGLTPLEGRLVADRYRIENVVSSGANTVVTEAIDTTQDRAVTVKIVRPERAVASAFRDEFRVQVAHASSLAHPNIGAVLDSGDLELDGEPTVFWVVEYLGGGSLRDLFDRGRLLQPSQALVVGLEACRALDAAHSQGIVHTEITPSKLVFGTDGRVRIIDFALARLLGEDAWSEPATVATHVARYASPEQALSLEVDAKTDVYALSLCLIEAITGKVPFKGDSTVSTLAGRVGRLMPVTADMGSMAAVLERGGRPDPEDRWTASEFANALVQAAESLPRPEPIPVLATSLFASNLAARHAAAAHRPGPAVIDADPHPAAELDDDTTELAADAAAREGAFDDESSDAGTEPAADDAGATADAAAVAEAAQVEAPAVAAGTVAAGEGGDDAVDDRSDEPLDRDPATGADDLAHSGGPYDVAAALPAPTAEMPAAMATDAAIATAPATTQIGVVDATPSGGLYDDERSSRPWGKYSAIGLVVIVGIVALGIAGYLLLRTKSFEVPDLVGVDEAVAINAVSGNGWEIRTERERSDEVPEVDHVVRTVPVAGERLAEGETFVIYVSDGPLLRTLPELTGVPIDEARATLADLRLVLVEREPQYSETVPAGHVILWQVADDSSLAAGAQVLPETEVAVVVSLGPEPRPAPALAGLTPSEATAALDALQLVYAPGEDVFSSEIEAGRVAVQDPPPGTPVERGGSVLVQVSKGPELVPLPDLGGMTFPQATEALQAAGFVVGDVLGTTEGTFFSMSVGGDRASAGEAFPKGSTVDLVFLL